MSILGISSWIVYDEDSSCFMFYSSEWDGVKTVPSHYITSIVYLDASIRVICDSKHHKETFEVQSDDPASEADKMTDCIVYR